jgi:hypothetical protein
MRILQVTLVALAVCVGGIVEAQLPFPGQPEPDFSRRPQCTGAYVRSIEEQTAAMERLRTAGPEVVGQVCALIEAGRAWLGGDLSDGTRRQLKEMLGFDVDLARLAAQCRMGQGNLERELITHLGYLRSELLRCDTI